MIKSQVRFGEYQYDSETEYKDANNNTVTGLYYLNARHYDPGMARFLEVDTYTGELNDPLSLNLYTYCHNGPLMYSDPSGHYEGEREYLKNTTLSTAMGGMFSYEVQTLQMDLRYLGWYLGQANGLFNEATLKADNSFKDKWLFSGNKGDNVRGKVGATTKLFIKREVDLKDLEGLTTSDGLARRARILSEFKTNYQALVKPKPVSNKSGDAYNNGKVQILIPSVYNGKTITAKNSYNDVTWNFFVKNIYRKGLGYDIDNRSAAYDAWRQDTYGPSGLGVFFTAFDNALFEGAPIDRLQSMLDLAGNVPVFGEPIDGVNGIIYFARGDKLNGALSMGSMVPFVGNGLAGVKLANKGRKAYEVAENAADLRKLIGNLDSLKGGSLGNIDKWKFTNPSFQEKILKNVPDINKFKDRTVAIIGHKDSIIPFQKTKGLDSKINVFKANNFGPGGWNEQKNLQWIKGIVENNEVVYFASQKLNVGDSWTREEIKYLLDCGYKPNGSYFLPPK